MQVIHVKLSYFITVTLQRLFTQPFVQTQIKENIKAPRHWLLCGNSPVTGEFTHKCPVSRKCFHLMTSSCFTRQTISRLGRWVLLVDRLLTSFESVVRYLIFPLKRTRTDLKFWLRLSIWNTWFFCCSSMLTIVTFHDQLDFASLWKFIFFKWGACIVPWYSILYIQYIIYIYDIQYIVP